MSSPLFQLQHLAEAATNTPDYTPVLQTLDSGRMLAEAVLTYLQRPVDLHPTLQRVREKLAARLYSPSAEEDVSALLELLTSSLASLERRADPPSLHPAMPPLVTDDWMSLRPAVAWTRIAKAVGLPFGAPLEVAAAVEALVQKVAHAAENVSPQPSVPDEWGATDLHTEMGRIQANVTAWRRTAEMGHRPNANAWALLLDDQEATLAALRRADSVIRAQAHDLEEARELAGQRKTEAERLLNAVRLAANVGTMNSDLVVQAIGALRNDLVDTRAEAELLRDVAQQANNDRAELRLELAKEHENSAALRAEINDVVAERNRLAGAIRDGDIRDAAIERDKQAVQTARIAAYGRGWEDSRQHNWNQGPDLSACLADYLRSLG